MNAEQRLALYADAEAMLSEQVPLVPLYYYSKSKLISPAVIGWQENAIDYISYKHLVLAQ